MEESSFVKLSPFPFEPQESTKSVLHLLKISGFNDRTLLYLGVGGFDKKMEVHCKRAAIESQLRYLCKIVAAGWPSWLATVAGEAIEGWLPRHADSFEKLDKKEKTLIFMLIFCNLLTETKFNFYFKNYVMAEEATKAMEPNADLLEWTKRDKRRLLHAVYRPVTLSVAMSEVFISAFS
ncbi:hypothetical protein DKX38_018145 [Salix brachista]|uniref:Uncharacterized protein n=1 Tax=Salix brachista TaxID=2182728 RepID=A0A5N5KX70_9ROSI|nr:hypothetical protein DKX38_018145 [Salix brachista]